jgi:hypothetical protein
VQEKDWKKLILKNYAVWGALVLSVSVLFVLKFNFNSEIRNIILNIGVSIFVAFTVSYFLDNVMKKSSRNQFDELVEEAFPKLKKIDKIGLEDIIYDNRMKNIDNNIEESDDLYIIMNDGRNFFTNNSDWLSRRFKLKHKNTTVVLLDDESESQKILCKRNEKSENNYYATKIKEAIKDFVNFYQDHSDESTLKIYKYNYYFMTSVVATEKYAIVGTYRNAAGKQLVPPQFIFRKECEKPEYEKIMDDIKNIIKKSKEVKI